VTNASAPRIATSRHALTTITRVSDMSVTLLSMPARRPGHKRRRAPWDSLLRSSAPLPALRYPASEPRTLEAAHDHAWPARRRVSPRAPFHDDSRRVHRWRPWEMPVDDVYCPACRLVLYRRGAGQVAPRHCPRCIARRRRLVMMVALDRLGPPDPDAEQSGESIGASAPSSTTNCETG
jgi:hypothetical protein